MADRPYWHPSQEQEDAWNRHKQACYTRWREKMLAKAVLWCSSARGKERTKRLEYVRERFSLDFMRETMRRMQK